MATLTFTFSIHQARLCSMSETQIKFAKNQVPRYQRAWNKEAKKVLSALNNITPLELSPDPITVYVTANKGSFSDPLCVDTKHSSKEIVDIVTHELIHRLITDRKAVDFAKLKKDYPTSELVRNHILVHAIHAQIYKKLSLNGRLLRDVRYCQQYPEYKEAWDIVLQEWPARIIKRYIK